MGILEAYYAEARGFKSRRVPELFQPSAQKASFVGKQNSIEIDNEGRAKPNAPENTKECTGLGAPLRSL